MVTNATEDLHVITLACQTQNSPEVELFLNAVKSLPAVEDAKVSGNNSRGAQVTFNLTVTFKADALKPTALPTVATNKS